ncbi:septum site-determining protein MinC [Scopulibacillus cellulosilyticus]|uniref:Probable septum site-determining protein MinC n=1 Tax=Scopulibacillus cellulosilyticus TaxID=2665665 RepID=A0ABW2PUZ2_9BACL
MSNVQPLVTIKGRKDGLVLSLNDKCSYDNLILELKEKLLVDTRDHEGPLIPVRIEAGYRYLSAEQKEEITDIVRSKKKLYVDEINSHVLSKKECENQLKQSQLTSKTQIVRSGQVLEIEGDLLLIGDVNPGARVIATGSIYVMGSLRGIAHAGKNGNHEAVIAASLMKPTQLRIGEVISRSPDNTDDNKDGQNTMECAFVDPSAKQIAIDRIQSLFKRNKQLARLT